MTDLATDWYGGHIATFGDRLVAARDAAQLSQQQLSKHLGVRLKTLKSWEIRNTRLDRVFISSYKK